MIKMIKVFIEIVVGASRLGIESILLAWQILRAAALRHSVPQGCLKIDWVHSYNKAYC
jgi:hypothetical protein